MVAEGHRRHLAGNAGIVRRLTSLGALPAGTDPTAITDTLTVLTDVTLGLLLIDQYGWTTQRTEQWMTATLRHTILNR